jgi:hypothetical protein
MDRNITVNATKWCDELRGNRFHALTHIVTGWGVPERKQKIASAFMSENNGVFLRVTDEKREAIIAPCRSQKKPSETDLCEGR